MSKSEIGCCLSHLLAIKTAYNNGDEYALILEDDVQLNLLNILDINITELVDNAPEDWEIIKFFSIRDPYENDKPIKTYKYFKYYLDIPIKYPTWGAQSYLLNKKGMKNVIDYTVVDNNSFYIQNKNNIFTHGRSDDLIFQIAKTYNVLPGIFYPNNLVLNSTIHDDHTNKHIKRSYDTVLSIYKTSSKTSSKTSTTSD